MDYLKRDEITRPVLRTERVTMQSLGKDVTVRALMLHELVSLQQQHADLAKPQGSEAASDAAVRAGAQVVTRYLAVQVVLEDGEPLWTADEWAVHGAVHAGEVMALHMVASRLAGGDAALEEAKKN